MKTKTKCTLTFSGLLIIELLPIPITSIFCLFVIRKRPLWLPRLVERLYSSDENNQHINIEVFDGYDPLVTRRRCTVTLFFMLLLDFLIPFTILFGLFIVRKQPIWFYNLIKRLYADMLNILESNNDDLTSSSVTNPLDTEALEYKYIELQKSNTEFALSRVGKTD